MKEISFMNAICVRKSVILKCVQLFEANRNYEYNVVNVRTYFHRQITLMIILKLYMKYELVMGILTSDSYNYR